MTGGLLTPRQLLVTKVVVGVAVLVALLWLPQGFEPFRVNQFSRVITLAIAALGLNLLTGYSGQISIGHGAFFGVGAYTTAILVADHGWPFLGSTVAAAALAFLVGVAIGIPALRIRGLYLALVTIALAVLFPQIIKRFSELTGGTQGKRVPGFDAPDWSGLADDQWVYYVLLAVALLSWLLVRNLIRSRVGRALIAIRDNEIAAEVLGVNLAYYKVVTFGVSAMLAGIGGSLSVYVTGFVDARSFDIRLSIEILVAVVIGGVATVFGPAIGAFLIEFVPEWTQDYSDELSPAIFGALLILLMILMPGGVIGGLRRVQRWAVRQIQARRPERAPPPGASPDAGTPRTAGRGDREPDGDLSSAASAGTEGESPPGHEGGE